MYVSFIIVIFWGKSSKMWLLGMCIYVSCIERLVKSSDSWHTLIGDIGGQVSKLLVLWGRG